MERGENNRRPRKKEFEEMKATVLPTLRCHDDFSRWIPHLPLDIIQNQIFMVNGVEAKYNVRLYNALIDELDKRGISHEYKKTHPLKGDSYAEVVYKEYNFQTDYLPSYMHMSSTQFRSLYSLYVCMENDEAFRTILSNCLSNENLEKFNELVRKG